MKTEYIGPPQSNDRAGKNNLIAAYRKNRRILYVIQALTFIFLVIALASIRYETSLTNLDAGVEQGISFGIAALLVIVWAIFWRCPNCGYHFLWRTEISKCKKCGVELIKPRIPVNASGEVDFRYYIEAREADSLKYGIYFALIVVVNLIISWLIVDTVPSGVLFIIIVICAVVPILIIDDKFHRCPKCGIKYRSWMSRETPEECPSCKTQLKYYDSSDWP